jgi:hypothetical protein
MKTTDTSTLKVHVNSGRVWYAEGENQTRHDGEVVEEFIENPVFCAADNVRLIGSHSNARMISLLYDMKQKGKIRSVEVATPLICATAEDRKNRPEEVIKQLRLCALAASVGGFHEVTEADYRSYALIVAVQGGTKGGVPSSKQALRLLRAHPAWKALSFIKSLDEAACAGLLSFIIDPRWYVDTAKPNRRTKFESAMGLDPRTQRAVSEPGKHKKGKHHKRCGLVLKCWKNPRYGAAVRDMLEVTSPIPVDDSDKPGIAPYDFVWRVWGHYMQLGVDEPSAPPDPVKADLRASQFFLSFLRHTWTAELYRDSCALPDRCAGLFRPADFFRHASEVAAYEIHQLGVEAQ